MRLYQKKINSLGIDNSKLSKGLKAQVDNLREAEEELNNLESQLEGIDENDEDYEEKQGEVQDLREAIDEADMRLVAAIEDWWAKREIMVERGKYMQQAKKAKQAAAAAGQPAPAPQPQPAPQPAPQPQPQPTPQPAPVVEEKKKGSGSWILWGGLALVGALIGVNLMRNRD